MSEQLARLGHYMEAARRLSRQVAAQKQTIAELQAERDAFDDDAKTLDGLLVETRERLVAAHARIEALTQERNDGLIALSETVAALDDLGPDSGIFSSQIAQRVSDMRDALRLANEDAAALAAIAKWEGEYLRMQMRMHSETYDERGCRCDWCKVVRDHFGYDDPASALAAHNARVKTAVDEVHEVHEP